MILFQQNFSTYTKDRQPYSIQPEKVHKYSGWDGCVKASKFHLKRAHARQFFLMPCVSVFRLSLKISYTAIRAMDFLKQNTTAWGISFGYDKKARTGYQLTLRYQDTEQTLAVSLDRVNGVTKEEIACYSLNDIQMPPEEEIPLELLCKDNKAIVTVFGRELFFAIDPRCGVIGVSKEGGVSEIVFSDILVEGDAPEKKLIWENSFRIPRTDGGVLDYQLQLSIYQTENTLFEIAYVLTGGAYEQESEAQGADCWVWEYDVFDGLYFSFGNEQYYISNDRLVFVEHTHPELKRTLNGSDIPYAGSFFVEQAKIPKRIQIGYDKRFSLCAGNLVSDRCFFYAPDGTLLHIGKTLTQDCFFEVRSDPEKAMTKRIPKDSPDYEDALFHAQKNHYFLTEEEPVFWIDVYTKLDPTYLMIQAELESAWLEPVMPLSMENIPGTENLFDGDGYQKLCFKVRCPKQEQGVYHVKISCQCGSDQHFEHVSAFEVLDDSKPESPQSTAGFPEIYCGDGFPTKYSTYDLAVVRPDFNITHYIDGSLHIPVYAEHRRTWELLQLYHRKLYIWMTQRGLHNKNETYLDYPGTVKHADYINYPDPGIEDCRYYYRYETCASENFDGKNVRALYQEFLTENPEPSEVFPPIENENMNPVKWKKIPCDLYDRWVTYLNERVRPWFVEQWNEILTVNPNAKRFSYGPFPTYFSNHAGGYSTKWRGFSKDGLDEVFEGGFLKLEDYPFVCGYQTYHCAWAMATIKLIWEKLRIAPDLYDSFGDDCPDGAVGYAHPPLGESYAPPYQTVTQLYEYLYNTAMLDRNGFRFWNDNFINMYDHISHEPEKRWELFLRAWKIFLDHQPKRPLGRIAFLTDYQKEDDRRTLEIDNLSIYNKNQTAMSVMHEVVAEMGIPQGFVTNWEALSQIEAEDLDILVLPSLHDIDGDRKEKLLDLHQKGVALIATGDVCGFEELFGVRECHRTSRIDTLSYRGEEELVYPYRSELLYRSSGAEVLLSGGTEEILLKNRRTLLLNASLGEVGVDSLVTPALPYAERANISRLIRKALANEIRSFSNPVLHTDEGIGACVVVTGQGETLLTLTDYSAYSDCKTRRISVWFDRMQVHAVTNLSYEEHELSMSLYEKNGFVDGFSTLIRPHEVLIYKIEGDIK